MCLIVLSLILSGCTEKDRTGFDNGSDEEAEAIKRVISLDYCADQYVLQLLDRNRIQALSADAGAPFSYLRDQAIGIPRIKGRTEDVLIRRPDLVVRSFGGGPNATAFFERVGIPVVNLGWSPDIPGIMATIDRMGTSLGAEEQAHQTVADMKQRLSAIEQVAVPKRVLYVTPSGVTSGPGSMVHEIIKSAGHENFETRPGWHPISLETLAYTQPDILLLTKFETMRAHRDPWSVTRHPMMKKLQDNIPVVAIDEAVMSCDAWYILDAVEALANEPGAS